MIKNFKIIYFRIYGGGGGGDKHRIKNYELLVIPSLRLIIEYIKQYKNVSEKYVRLFFLHIPRE
jgi:hypothetical protein